MRLVNFFMYYLSPVDNDTIYSIFLIIKIDLFKFSFFLNDFIVSFTGIKEYYFEYELFCNNVLVYHHSI